MAETANLRDPAFIQDPFPVLAELRRSRPVHFNRSLGGWVLTRYQDVHDVLRDPRLSADRISPFMAHQSGPRRDLVAELVAHLKLWTVFTDPPTHTRLRGLMNKAFTTRAIERLRPQIQQIVDTLLDPLAGGGEMDAIAEFAYPLPATVIADMLGVPRRDVDKLKRWSDLLGAFVLTARINPDRYDQAAVGVREMSGYFSDLIAQRRRNPGPDITSALVAAQDADDRLSDAEIIAACVLMLFAGHETTTQLIGNGLYALTRHPEQLAALMENGDDPVLIRNAVEEMLRWDGPSLASVRIASEDVCYGDETIRAGDRVVAMIAAANRDPAMFPEPDRFDIRRDNAGRHLTFGFGIHFCIGAPLARLEGEIAFATIARRFSGISRRPDPLNWSDSLIVRGVEALPLAFTARRAS